MRIAAYGCVGDWAQSLGETAASGLLDKTLEEEKETDRKLTELARGEINLQAKEYGGRDEEEQDAGERSSRRKARGARA